MPGRGFFITVEGIDGTGKTTQLNLLREYFEREQEQIVMAKEPGDLVGANGRATYIGSNIGHYVRHMMFKDPTTHRMVPGVNDLLFMADHVQLQGEVIAPALAAGKIVLCDRYSDSEFAYATEKNPPRWVLDAFRRSTSIEPDVTILLMGNPQLLLARTKRTGTSEEGKQAGKTWAAVEAQARIQHAYLQNLQGLERTILVDVTEESVETADCSNCLVEPRLLRPAEVHALICIQLIPRYLRHVSAAEVPDQLELFPTETYGTQ